MPIHTDLQAHAADDWYLPAQDELSVLYDNKDSIGNFQPNWYWSSSEGASHSGKRMNFADGTQELQAKQTSLFVRCIRKGPAPRCTDPYGIEGNMFYNTDHDVVQFCDGVRWIAIGKTAP